MIKFQKIVNSLIVFLSFGILFSCSDDDNTAPFDVVGDVFVTKRMIGDEVQFANSYYAYGTQPMTMAQVTTPVGMEIQLNSTSNDGYTLGYPANDTDFSADAPLQGNYTFNVIHEEIQHQTIDLLVFNNIDFTEISLTDMQNDMLVVEWVLNADAEVYMLRLMNDEGEVIFNSPTLPGEATRYEIDTFTGSGSWADGYPISGETYTLELHAFLFDEEATEIDFTFNIQEVSISEEMVDWN